MTNTEKWRLLNSGFCDPVYNMALDEALLMGASKHVLMPTIRFYGWTRPAITLGYRQDYFKDLNIEEVKKEKIPVIRRITGGLGVYHWNEITYSTVFQYSTLNDIKTAKQWYELISLGLVEALNQLGINASVVSEKSNKKFSIRGRIENADQQPMCFALPLGVDITVNGKKIVGSAQRKFKNIFLQQGSILVKRDPEKEIAFFHLPDTKKVPESYENIYNKVTSISEEIETVPEFSDLIILFKKGMEKILKIHLIEGDTLDSEKIWCDELIETKYSTEKWNFHGSWQVQYQSLK